MIAGPPLVNGMFPAPLLQPCHRKTNTHLEDFSICSFEEITKSSADPRATKHLHQRRVGLKQGSIHIRNSHTDSRSGKRATETGFALLELREESMRTDRNCRSISETIYQVHGSSRRSPRARMVDSKCTENLASICIEDRSRPTGA